MSVHLVLILKPLHFRLSFFCLIMFKNFHETIVYTALAHNNKTYLPEVLIVSLIHFWAPPLDVHVISLKKGQLNNVVNMVHVLNICSAVYGKDLSFHAGGNRVLQQSYIRKLAAAMDELFLQKFGVHPSLVCDMYQYNCKKAGMLYCMLNFVCYCYLISHLFVHFSSWILNLFLRCQSYFTTACNIKYTEGHTRTPCFQVLELQCTLYSTTLLWMVASWKQWIVL